MKEYSMKLLDFAIFFYTCSHKKSRIYKKNRKLLITVGITFCKYIKHTLMSGNTDFKKSV